MSSALEVTEATFEEQVLKSELPVLVDFWAEWCQPCKMLSPTIDAIASELDGRMKVYKLDVQANSVIANKYSIRNIPALLIFKAGEPVDRLIGFQSKQDLLSKLEKHL
ncbi:MAG TPA: thioredoxin [Armatimonadota bacterium]|nr:thioredoxin [Armatimonadota bacterium]HOM73222.1 thioredoxin [Armatimonadota bacterium]HPP74315.1 thioredoxin [Armatimonadota bacterium]